MQAASDPSVLCPLILHADGTVNEGYGAATSKVRRAGANSSASPLENDDRITKDRACLRSRLRELAGQREQVHLIEPGVKTNTDGTGRGDAFPWPSSPLD